MTARPTVSFVLRPRCKGCVRQRRADAEHLWSWAPDGTTVRVTA